MKQIISVFLAVIMIAAPCFLARNVGAAYAGFTVYCDPEVQTVSEDFLGEICVNVRLENNPGLWATRLFIVYSDKLSLADGSGNARVTNSGEVYSVTDSLTVGIPDLSLGDSRQPAEFKKLMTEKGIVKDGYRSLNIYFESDALDGKATADGILATLYFTLEDGVVTGDTADIKLYYCKQDFIGVSGSSSSPVFTEYSPATYGSQISVGGCSHTITYVDRKDADCTAAGYERVICSACEEVLSEAIMTQKGHTYITVTEEATCVKEGCKKKMCSECLGDVTVLETYPVIPHSYSETVVPPTNTEYGYTLHTCSACGDEYRDNYVDPDGISGDVNLDGKLNALDINVMKRTLIGTVALSGINKILADFDGDGSFNSVDVNKLSRYILGN